MEPLFCWNGIEAIPVFSTAQPDWNLEELHSRGNDLAYVLDAKGWVISKKTSLTTATVRVDSIDGVPALKEIVYLTTAKLSSELFDKIVAFFQRVFAEQKTEAAGLLFYNDGRKDWQFVVPPQQATGASAHYEATEEQLRPLVGGGYKLAGTIHSHGSMGAFHSGTDHKDEEKFDGLHITVGKVDSTVEYAISIVVAGKRFKFDRIGDVVDYGPKAEIPAEWLEAVKKEQPKEVNSPKLDEKAKEIQRELLRNEYFLGKMSDTDYFREMGLLSKSQKEDFRTLKDVEEEKKVRKDRSAKNSKQLGFLDVRRYRRWSDG